MVDTVDQLTRSRIMSRVGGKNTRPERVLKRGLHKMGFRYRIHVVGLPGRPDLAFARFRAVCFVHGCFWHRHAGCRRATDPATRVEFWQAKFRQNIQRDRNTKKSLLEEGWRVAVIWECALDGERVQGTVEEIGHWLWGSEPELEIPHGRVQESERR